MIHHYYFITKNLKYKKKKIHLKFYHPEIIIFNKVNIFLGKYRKKEV